MTLEEGKTLLQKENIPFQEVDYPNEAAFYRHIALFPCLRNRSDCKVKALVIKSRHGIQNIELQFSCKDDGYQLVDLYFGEFPFELSEFYEWWIRETLLGEIKEIMDGKMMVLVANDLCRKKWCADMGFDLEDEDDMAYFAKLYARIKRKKGFLAKLLKRKMRYEIFDFNSYRCIDK